MQRIRGQSIIEYSIVIALVVGIFTVMQAYLKRGIQAGVRVSAEQLGVQENGLADTDPREGTVWTQHEEKETEVPTTNTKSIYIGGDENKGSNEWKRSSTHSVKESLENGWCYRYNMATRTWELWRQP